MLDRLLELADVAGDEPEVELKGAAALEDLVAPHRAADRVERLIEGMAGGLRIGVGPEQREQLVPARAPTTSGGHHGEQGQTAALRGGTGVELPVLLQHQPAEGVQPQHAWNGMLTSARRAAR